MVIKIFKNRFKNHKAYDLETWYETLGPGPIIVCITDEPRLTLIYFPARSSHICVYMGKMLESHLIGTLTIIYLSDKSSMFI